LQHKAAGTIPQPYHEMSYFRPAELPGKIGFDTARRLNGSRVEEVIGDFSTMKLDPLRSQFDVVFYLGTLYHMADPLGNLRRLYEVTAPGGLAVVETQATAIGGLEDVPLCENYGPLHSLNERPRLGGAPTRRPGKCCSPLGLTAEINYHLPKLLLRSQARRCVF
jgi:hypothetical protein